MFGRLKCYILLIFFQFWLSACSGGVAHQYKIGVSQCSSDEWRQQFNSEFSREMLFHPEVQFEIVSAEDDNSKQIADIRRFIDEGVDVLAVSPNEADAIAPVIEEAYDKGIAVILIDRKISSDKFNAFIGADNSELGYMGGSYVASLADKLRDKPRSSVQIVEITGPSSTTPAMERHKGFTDALEENSLSAHTLSSLWTYDSAYAQFKSYLLSGGRVDIVFAHNDKMAKGARDAALFVGLCPNASFVGVDALVGDGLGVDMVERGVLDASLMYPTAGDKVASLAVDILKGRPYLRYNYLSTELVTEYNARIIRMQHSNIINLAGQIETLDGLLDSTMLNYRTQRKVLWGVAFLLVIIFILLIFAFWGMHRMRRLNVQLKDQKQQIERQREEKLAFFTNVSHDFRTPLTLISDPVNRLKHSGNINANERYLLDLVSKNVTLLKSLVNQILDFRKYECGKLELRLSEFELSSVLADWVDSFADVSWKKRINLSFECKSGASGVMISADMEKLERIIYNLLSNALKFTQEQGRVQVSLDYKDENFRIVVRDDGIGLAPDKIQRIFDNFYQADSVSYYGSGIGLAIVKAFVELHGGHIGVESSPGKGTSFDLVMPRIPKGAEVMAHPSSFSGCGKEQGAGSFTDASSAYSSVQAFPADASSIGSSSVDAPSADVSSVQASSSASSMRAFPADASSASSDLQQSAMLDAASNMRPSRLNIPSKPRDEEEEGNLATVLVIDDNADVRAYVKSVLSGQYFVIEAENGSSGIAAARKYVPDAVICDVMMPEMDGIEFCRRLKSELRISHIPVMLLTAYAAEDKKIEGYSCGADSYISKPFSSELLLSRLHNLLENRSRLRGLYSDSCSSASAQVDELDRGFINNLYGVVVEKLADSSLTVEYLAERLCLSRVQLYRKTKTLTGYSPNEYVRIIRLKTASDILSKEDRTVAEVAYAVGFTSPSYFAKCYRDYFGDSPKNFRS